jgi:hypothetical protein
MDRRPRTAIELRRRLRESMTPNVANVSGMIMRPRENLGEISIQSAAISSPPEASLGSVSLLIAVVGLHPGM